MLSAAWETASNTKSVCAARSSAPARHRRPGVPATLAWRRGRPVRLRPAVLSPAGRSFIGLGPCGALAGGARRPGSGRPPAPWLATPSCPPGSGPPTAAASPPWRALRGSLGRGPPPASVPPGLLPSGGLSRRSPTAPALGWSRSAAPLGVSCRLRAALVVIPPGVRLRPAPDYGRPRPLVEGWAPPASGKGQAGLR